MIATRDRLRELVETFCNARPGCGDPTCLVCPQHRAERDEALGLIDSLAPEVSPELRRVQKLRAGTIDAETTLEDLETILRARRARVSLAGRGGHWIAFAWLEDGTTSRGLGDTVWEAVAGALEVECGNVAPILDDRCTLPAGHTGEHRKYEGGRLVSGWSHD